jgi:glycosyltransferase involved in cell wall biosynthesis
MVSVIIIFLDAEAFLREAIDSVFAQDYRDWELLLVNDGSTDASTSIARETAARHSDKVFYLDHPGHENRGMSASRNRGLQEARGEYVAFLDADDVWLPGKLREQVALFEEHPRAAMVYGRTEIWWSWTNKPSESGRDHMLELGVTPDTLVEPPTLALRLLENKVQSPTTCNAIIRTGTVSRLGGFQEAFRGMFEDHAFFLKLCLREAVYVSGRSWAKYRQHSRSCCAMAEARGIAWEARRPLLHWLKAYCGAEGIHDPGVLSAVRRELLPYDHPTVHRLLQISTPVRRKLRNTVRRLLRMA